MPSKCALALVALALLTGCQRAMLRESVINAWPSPETELEYLDRLSTEPAVTNNDALHCLILVEDGVDPSYSYEQRLNYAKERKWVSADWSRPANEVAAVGDISVVVCRLLDIKGGLTMSLFGPSPRACTRELVFLNIIPDRTENQSLTGLEMIDLMSRVQGRVTALQAQRAGEDFTQEQAEETQQRAIDQTIRQERAR